MNRIQSYDHNIGSCIKIVKFICVLMMTKHRYLKMVAVVYHVFINLLNNQIKNNFV